MFRAPYRYSSAQSGFTLIELIIVIVIIGIMASLTTVNLSDNKRELLQTEMKRFQVLFELARQESILQSQQLGLRFSQGQYQFYQMQQPDISQQDSDKNTAEQKPIWQAINRGTLKARPVPSVLLAQVYIDDISISLTTAKQSSKDTPDIQSSETLSTEQSSQKPQVFILSSGENTPFEYQLDYSGVGRANIKIDAVGAIELNYHYDNENTE